MGNDSTTLVPTRNMWETTYINYQVKVLLPGLGFATSTYTHLEVQGNALSSL